MSRVGADLRTPAALALAAAVGIWPYLGTLGFGPMTLDAVHWIQRGGADAPARWDWIFGSAHFIAYRPLTALSFALTGAAGDAGALHRLFDVALHVTNGVLVWAVARRLPNLPGWGALLAAALFLTHPVAEEVVPWIARRGYGLATGFSLGALLLVSRSLAGGARDPVPLRHALGAATCLLAAVLSNEVAFTAAAILPAWAFATAAPGARSVARVARACGPALAAAAAAVVVRSFFVEGVGGYSPDTSLERFAAVYTAFWRDLLAYSPDYPLARAALHSALLAVAGAGLLGCTAYALLAARSGRTAGAPLLVLVGWLVFASVLLCAQNVWFARELLPLVPALALWLVATLCDALAWRRGWALAPLAVMLALLLHSPSLRGPDPVRVARWSESQAVLDDLVRELDAATTPTWVGLALGYRRTERHGAVRARRERAGPPRFLRLAPLWLGPRYAERGHAIETVLALPGSLAGPPEATLFESHGAPLLRVPRGREIERLADVPTPREDAEGEQVLPLHELPYPAGLRPRFYLRVDGRGQFVTLPGRRS